MNSRVRVKICGITNQKDAEAAIEAGADALGFNTWRGSKRWIDLAAEEDWIGRLPPFVTKVALTVNASLEEARILANRACVDLLQLHGDEDAAYCRALASIPNAVGIRTEPTAPADENRGSSRPFIKAIRLRTEEDINNLESYGAWFFLLDAHVEGQFGGTGMTANPEIIQQFRTRFPNNPLLLAGGLHPGNVGKMVSRFRPYAVDVSSGVESVPGKKDVSKMREFVAAAREI